MNIWIKRIISGVAGGLVTWLIWALALPAWNLSSPGFWAMLLVASMLEGISMLIVEIPEMDYGDGGAPILSIVCGIIAATILVIPLFGGWLFSTPMFHAEEYQHQIQVSDGTFEEEIAQIDLSQVPLLDQSSAERLGDRTMGNMLEYISQFEVSTAYAQINLADKPIRVTPLEYGGLFKYSNNKLSGVPGYVTVDMVTQEAELVKLEEGMKIVPSAYFGNDLRRFLRHQYPSLMFDETTFEVDENGKPWYVVSVVEYTIGWLGGKDVCGCILLDPCTGESTYYDVDQVPEWIDQLYAEKLITAQINNWGQYKRGFWNSAFGQKECLNCTQGYSHIAKDNDIWLYTGMTSVGKDESNVGFIMVNLRTKEARYYNCPGAEEYSAMSSAEGALQNLRYTATFPILVNLADEPTYLMAMKDEALLVKKYALVNVQEYQNVATGDTLNEAISAYTNLLKKQNAEITSITGCIVEIVPVVKDGTTYYYIDIDEDDIVYIASISISDMLPFKKAGDNITFEYQLISDVIANITGIQ